MNSIKLFSFKGILVRGLPMLSLLLFSFGEIFRGTAYIIISFLLVIPFVGSYITRIGLTRSLFNFIILIFLGSIFNLFVTNNGFGGTLLFLTNVALALYCLNNICYVKYLALIVLLYNLAFLYEKIFVETVDPNYIYEVIGLSRNHPGMLLVIWTCFWGFTKYMSGLNTSIVLSLLSCAIAFLLEGRSSLGILLFLSIASLCMRNRFHIYVVPILICFLVYAYWGTILDIYMMTSFAENSLGSARYDIWRAYYEALDFISLLGGLELSEVPLIRTWGNNPHNFLLNFHYRMGLLGVFALVVLIIKSVKAYMKSREYVPLLYLSCLIARFMFDACINSTYDFILYTILLYPLLRKPKTMPIFYYCTNKKKSKFLKNIVDFI